jgi:hypothetical protein
MKSLTNSEIGGIGSRKTDLANELCHSALLVDIIMPLIDESSERDG